MERRLLILTALVALAVPVAASGQSAEYGLSIRGATVNSDHSVTIAWQLESASATSMSIAVDGVVVGAGSGGATIFTTRPLSGGRHTITIQMREIFEAYSPPSGATCEVSGGHWLCARHWLSSINVSVPVALASPVVPAVVGLQLKVATARIRDAGYSLGSVKRLHSKRRAGTVLRERPKASIGQLLRRATISLVVSSGRRRAGTHA